MSLNSLLKKGTGSERRVGVTDKMPDREVPVPFFNRLVAIPTELSAGRRRIENSAQLARVFSGTDPVPCRGGRRLK